MKFLVYVLIFFLLTAFSDSGSGKYAQIRNTSFTTGEVLDYRVSFGFFTVGKATTTIERKVFNINDRPCYKVDAHGETLGFVSWITKVDDIWGAYIDTAALVTHASYRKLKEGNYRKDEWITYDHENLMAEVKVLDKETKKYGEPKYFKTPENVRDLVAGFMYLRVLEFNKYKKGDTLTVSGFFEDTAYHLKIIYAGKEKVETKVGVIPCHKLIPVMPDNKLFDGENSITCWISDDRNKIPVKISARMFIGSTGVELSSFKGLRNQLRVLME